MKKLYFLWIALVGSMLTIQAQNISRDALGVRFGNNDGLGGEISYQRELSEVSRLELDLGFRNNPDFNAFKLTGIKQWVFYIDGEFNWYVGFGAGIGSWSKNKDYNADYDDGFMMNVNGNIGIEYDFNIPLLISLDFRPEFNIIGDFPNDTGMDFGLSLRYQFF